MYINRTTRTQRRSYLRCITMRGFTIFFLLTLALCVHGLPALSPRIVGGHDAPVGKYPYIVSLRIGGSIFCAGSILNKRYILTAGHCLSGISLVGFENFYVSVGTYSANETGTIYKPDEIIMHEQFDFWLIDNDVGLIRLATDIAFTDKIQPIQLADKEYEEGYAVRLIGWGQRGKYKETFTNLQEVDLKISSRKACKAVHPTVRETNICTFTKTGEGACNGDSGGPLVADNKQVGIVSYGQPCAIGYPDVFTRVTSYKGWIAKHTSGV